MKTLTTIFGFLLCLTLWAQPVQLVITGSGGGGGGNATNALLPGPGGNYDASLVTNLNGAAIQLNTVSSNALDAATRAMLGTGTGGTNNHVYWADTATLATNATSATYAGTATNLVNFNTASIVTNVVYVQFHPNGSVTMGGTNYNFGGSTTLGVMDIWNMLPKGTNYGLVNGVCMDFDVGDFLFTAPLIFSNNYPYQITLRGGGIKATRFVDMRASPNGVPFVTFTGKNLFALGKNQMIDVRDIDFIGYVDTTNVLTYVDNFYSTAFFRNCTWSDWVSITNIGSGNVLSVLLTSGNPVPGLVGLRFYSYLDHAAVLENCFFGPGLADGVVATCDHFLTVGVNSEFCGYNGSSIANLWPQSSMYSLGAFIIHQGGLDAAVYYSHSWAAGGGFAELQQDNTLQGNTPGNGHVVLRDCQFENPEPQGAFDIASDSLFTPELSGCMVVGNYIVSPSDVTEIYGPRSIFMLQTNWVVPMPHIKHPAGNSFGYDTIDTNLNLWTVGGNLNVKGQLSINGKTISGTGITLTTNSTSVTLSTNINSGKLNILNATGGLRGMTNGNGTFLFWRTIIIADNVPVYEYTNAADTNHVIAIDVNNAILANVVGVITNANDEVGDSAVALDAGSAFTSNTRSGLGLSVTISTNQWTDANSVPLTTFFACAGIVTNNILSANFTGNGAGLTNIQPAAVTNAPGFWAAAPAGSSPNVVTNTQANVTNTGSLWIQDATGASVMELKSYILAGKNGNYLKGASGQELIFTPNDGTFGLYDTNSINKLTTGLGNGNTNIELASGLTWFNVNANGTYTGNGSFTGLKAFGDNNATNAMNFSAAGLQLTNAIGTNTLFGGNITASGTVTASNFTGNAGGLTGLSLAALPSGVVTNGGGNMPLVGLNGATNFSVGGVVVSNGNLYLGSSSQSWVSTTLKAGTLTVSSTINTPSLSGAFSTASFTIGYAGGITPLITILSTNVNFSGSLTATNGYASCAPHTPVALTVGASPFSYTNNTPVAQECYFSGATAYAVTKMGASVYASMTGNSYFVLQPTNYCVLTYTVAPTVFTNAW